MVIHSVLGIWLTAVWVAQNTRQKSVAANLQTQSSFLRNEFSTLFHVQAQWVLTVEFQKATSL